MKIVLVSALMFIAYLGSAASCIWTIVEFILYLAKDRVFNWWSVWSILICGTTGLVLFFTFAVLTRMNEKNYRKTHGTKSRFQERLEEMAKQRKGLL